MLLFTQIRWRVEKEDILGWNTLRTKPQKKCVCVNIMEEEEKIRHQDIHTEIERACVANMYNEQCGNNRKTRTAQ